MKSRFRSASSPFGLCVLVCALPLWFPPSSHASEANAEDAAAPATVHLAQAPPAPDPEVGLSEAKRQVVFRELAAAEIRANHEAEQRFKAEPESIDKVNLAQSLNDRYQQQIADAHGLTEKQLVEIQAEGDLKSWPTAVP